MQAEHHRHGCRTVITLRDVNWYVRSTPSRPSVRSDIPGAIGAVFASRRDQHGRGAGGRGADPSDRRTNTSRPKSPTEATRQTDARTPNRAVCRLRRHGELTTPPSTGPCHEIESVSPQNAAVDDRRAASVFAGGRRDYRRGAMFVSNAARVAGSVPRRPDPEPPAPVQRSARRTPALSQRVLPVSGVEREDLRRTLVGVFVPGRPHSTRPRAIWSTNAAEPISPPKTLPGVSWALRTDLRGSWSTAWYVPPCRPRQPGREQYVKLNCLGAAAAA